MSRWWLLGAAAATGLVVGLNLRRTTDGKCCDRVRRAAAEKARGLCGTFCESLADSIGLIHNAPDILDLLGVD